MSSLVRQDEIKVLAEAKVDATTTSLQDVKKILAEKSKESSHIFSEQPPLPGSVTEFERRQARELLEDDPYHKAYQDLKKDPTYRPIRAMSVKRASQLGLLPDHAEEGETVLDKALAAAPTFEDHLLKMEERLKMLPRPEDDGGVLHQEDMGMQPYHVLIDDAHHALTDDEIVKMAKSYGYHLDENFSGWVGPNNVHVGTFDKLRRVVEALSS